MEDIKIISSVLDKNNFFRGLHLGKPLKYIIMTNKKLYGGYKKMTNLEIIKSIRNSWGNVNPVTRIHDSKVKTDTKKIRKAGKESVKKWKEEL